MFNNFYRPVANMYMRNSRRCACCKTLCVYNVPPNHIISRDDHIDRRGGGGGGRGLFILKQLSKPALRHEIMKHILIANLYLLLDALMALHTWFRFC